MEDVTVMSTRGQVVIPLDLRKKLHLKPKDRFIVYGEEDIVVMKKLEITELKETFSKIGYIIRERNKKYGTLTEDEIESEVSTNRKGK